MLSSLDFRIVADTNILWTRGEKTSFFSNDFLSVLKPKGGTNHTGYIAEITAKEIAYQKAVTAQANAMKFNDAVKALNALTGSSLVEADFSDLQAKVYAHLLEQLRKFRLTLLPTPASDIDWMGVVDDAVWRRAPFEGNPDSKTEKGFRDAVFVHSVLHHVGKDQGSVWCVLTNDGLAYQRLTEERGKKSFGEFEVFRTTEEFFGHVDMRIAKFEEALAENLQVKAHTAFYDPVSKNGIYVEAGVESLIEKQFSIALANVPVAGDWAIPSQWVKASDEKMFVEGTRFLRRLEGSRVAWATRLRLCAIFTRGTWGGVPVYPSSIIRDTRVDVKWSADVVDGHFSAARIDALEIGKHEQLSDTPLQRIQLGFPAGQSFDPAFGSLTSQPTLSTNIPVPSGSFNPYLGLLGSFPQKFPQSR